MKEDLLQYVWKMRLFGKQKLQTSEGEKIEILKTGEWNKNAGPDFLNARIKIGKTLWAGQVEIHLRSSDFIKHLHHKNSDYQNIILHVVYENDKVIQNSIPVLELREVISPLMLKYYNTLFQSNDWIPCEKLISKTKLSQLPIFIERLLVEKWQEKSLMIEELLKMNKNNWEETFYIFITRHFGLPVNTLPFEEMAQQIPLKTLAKCKNNLLQIEAMLFGVSGLLNSKTEDDYYKLLSKEYAFLEKKYALHQISTGLKFSRMRPVNFPIIRLSQLANLIYNSSHLLSKIIETKSLKDFDRHLNVYASAYWDTHFVFGKTSKSIKKNLGDETKQLLIINVFIPFIFFYARSHSDQKLMQQCLTWMEELKSEKNQIIIAWNTLGIKCSSAKESQALIHLKKNYCDKKRCLECRIGNQILNNTF